MRKIIEIYQEDLIVCDNPTCTYKVKNETGDPNIDTSKFINAPCPFCGENLLTEQDNLDALKLLKTVNWANKWFGWMSIFFETKTVGKKSYVHVHNGINVQSDVSS